MVLIVGVTFPIPKKYIDRFFTDGKTVFIKPATVFKELQPGMKFVFYQSQEDTGFIGEATIKKIILGDNPLVLFKRYKKSIFLSESEIEQYMESLIIWNRKSSNKEVGKSRKRQWMAFELKNIKKYNQIIKPDRFVTVGGYYIKE